MNQIRRKVIYLLFMAALNSRPQSAVAQIKRHIEPFNPEYKSWNYIIKQPGLYGLDENLTVRMAWGAGHTGPKGGVVLRIMCGQVDLDMENHSIDVHYGVSGIGLNASANRYFWNEKGMADKVPAGGDVSVRNGTIDLSHGDLTGVGIQFVDKWRSPDRQYLARGQNLGRFDASPTDVNYLKNNYLFENLKIFSHEIALAAEGTHTIIRNCIIESAGNAAIFIAGSDVLIENCEIRLKALVKSPDAYGTPLRAAIMLRDGSNAIIRNNRIRVDRSPGNTDWPSDTRCIVVRDGATNVLIENNTFVNTEVEWITEMDDSKTISRGNQAKVQWWPMQ